MIIPKGAKLPDRTYLPVGEIYALFAEATTYDYTHKTWTLPDHVHADDSEYSGKYNVWACGADLATCEPYLTVKV